MSQNLDNALGNELKQFALGLISAGVSETLCNPEKPSDAMIDFFKKYNNLEVKWDPLNPYEPAESDRISIKVIWQINQCTRVLREFREGSQPSQQPEETFHFDTVPLTRLHTSVVNAIVERLGQNKAGFDDYEKFNLERADSGTTRTIEYPGLSPIKIELRDWHYVYVIKNDSLILEQYEYDHSGERKIYRWMTIPCP